MSNWFKKRSQVEEVRQEPIRYRVMIPVDIWASTTGNPNIDNRNVYDMLEDMLNNGQETIQHQGFNSLLQPSDIKTHSEVTKEFGL